MTSVRTPPSQVCDATQNAGGGELVTRLLEVTHGQWLYRNVQIHDRITGTLATQQKEELQMEIE